MPTPSLNKGVLILLSPNATNAEISAANPYFVFQYNPEKLLHSFNHPLAPEAPQQQKSPTESFDLSFELDCADVESQTQKVSDYGLHPALAMLENMMRPQTIAGKTAMPIAIFNWGTKRSVPVQIVNMSVEETDFDVVLNPIRANIHLTLRVLDASGVNSNVGARNVYSNHQAIRAALVEAYKSQTEQALSGGKVTGASATSSRVTAQNKIQTRSRMTG